MPRSSLLVPAITCALALGCADSKSPTAPTTTAAGNLANSVERSTVDILLGIDDGIQIVFIGGTVEDLVNAFCTGAPFEVDQVTQLLVTRPDGSMKLQIKGDVNVVVMDLTAFEQSFCEDPSAVATHTGTGRLALNDSDLDLSGPGADAAQVHVVGTVTDQGGQRYHLVAFVQSVVAPEFTSPDDFEFLHGHAKIELTPNGG
jgi:hypothetical protein